MSQHEGFLRDIVEHPDDDAPRLIYADWLEEHGDPERAEFIRVQIELVCLPARKKKRIASLLAREKELLAAHEAEWTAQLTAWGVKTSHFFRGFVNSVLMPVRAFLDHAAEMMASNPIEHLWLIEAEDLLPQLIVSPQLARLHSLTLQPALDNHSRALAYQGIDAEGGALLAGSPHLSGLMWLFLTDNALGEEGTAALAASPYLGHLLSLHLDGNGVGDRGVRALAQSRHLKQVMYLNLRDNLLSGLGAQALAESRNAARLDVLWLGQNFLGDLGVLALASSPHLRRLYFLDLSSNQVGPEGARELSGSATLKQLRKLNLQDNPLGDEGARALAASPYLKKLEELKVGHCEIGPDGEAALRARFGDAVVF